MFGHDDQSQHHENSVQPTPDGALHDNQGGMSMPPVDDTAGDYMDDPATTPTEPAAAPATSTPAATAPAANADELLSIKQQALQQLTPLIGHLEQNPEEKFRTTMMMIQAADNDALIKTAYEAALAIPDEKVRAQALLDIVNEINYFTHGSNPQA